jgi:hypothetical protein
MENALKFQYSFRRDHKSLLFVFRRRGRNPEVISVTPRLRLPSIGALQQPYNIMTSRFVQVSKPGGPLEIVDRDIPEPGPAQVRIKVQACGIYHSDSLIKEGQFPGILYPRVPGHEVAGVIDKVGSDVTDW